MKTIINPRIKCRIVSVVLLLLLAGWGCLHAQSTRSVHVVRSGETLYRIGKQYGVTVAELYRLNPSARQGIRPGDELVLPIGATSTEGAEYYDIKKGDTLYSIAKRAGVTVSELMALNPSLKSPDQIAVGMIIRLPGYADDATDVLSPQVRPAAADSLNGIRMVTVQSGATVYSLVRGTPWSEEDFYRYNPQVREKGLRAGEPVFLPDGSIKNNLATRGEALQPYTGEDVLDVVLALPFGMDREHRFADYYEGLLLSVLEAKRSGVSINLYVYSCDDKELPATKMAIRALGDVDLIIGGVSISSIRELSDLAKYKDATYVIPFSARELSAIDPKQEVYQVNTPASIQYDRAAQKFLQAYAGYHVLFVGPLLGEDESPFVRVLKNQLSLSGQTFSECAASDFSGADDVRRQAMGHAQLVVVPSSSSLPSASQVLGAIGSTIEGVEETTTVTAFGYPEWQTYASSLSNLMYLTESTFFTTFYIYSRDEDYRRFASDFMRWFGHGTGNTFPRYSALGYDTGSYFLQKPGTEIDREPFRGVQSLLDFTSGGGYDASGVRSSGGVFFVRHNRDKSISRF